MALKGVGKSIAKKVLEYQRTGTIRKVHDLQHDPVIRARIKLLTVFGIGPVKAKQLVSPPLSLRTLKDLRQAHRQGTAGLQRAQILGLTHYTDLHTRIPYEDIYGRYGPLMGDEIMQETGNDAAAFCEAIALACDVATRDYALGLTKLFLKVTNQPIACF